MPNGNSVNKKLSVSMEALVYLRKNPKFNKAADIDRIHPLPDDRFEKK